jgi:NAD(P)H-hydrate epimerase
MPAPIISVAQMREWEKASWATGLSESNVIYRVGEIVARHVRQLTQTADLVVILAGKGHNGDDARQAANHLPDQRVQVCRVTDPAGALPEIKALSRSKPALIVDGLFGIGINRPLDEHWRALIQYVNDLNTRILAVDVPSGLNADTGEPEGAAIRASITLTLGAPKKGLLLPLAWEYVGRLEVAPDIGLISSPVTSEMNWTLPEDFAGYPPDRAAIANKGNFGRLCIIAGSTGFHGASVLASRGAQRAQPGLITLHTCTAVYPVVASQLQAVMVNHWKPELELPDHYNALLIGPGLAGEDVPDALKEQTQKLWLESTVPVIVDASALDWLPQAPLPDNFLRVITPHPGEAGRLLKTSAKQVQANRAGALREISQHYGNCWVVLKGSQTLIGRSKGEMIVNSSGNPHLAQGGSGDVLGGYLGGLLAQPALQADPLKTIACAVWEHGAAADRLTQKRNNWVVEDLITEIGNRRQ